MAKSIKYDDSQLQVLFKKLDEKNRVKALRGAFRREAAIVKKQAQRNVKASFTKAVNPSELVRGVRSSVFSEKLGFRVTVGTKGKTLGYHTNRFGLQKPVLMWGDIGTVERRTKSNFGHARRFARRLRSSHKTGRMPAYRFMAKTSDQVMGSATDSIHNEIRKYVTRTAIRCDCKPE